MMNKWIGISLGAIVGLSHIGMIGVISRQQKFPVVNLPVGPYTAYTVKANKEGYLINYRANDPLVMEVTKDVKRPGGFLGLGTKTIKTRELYTMDGSQHLEDRESGNGLSKTEVACIKAEGGGEQTGRIVGGGLGAAAGTSLASVPYVGWVLAGAATMIGMDTGADIGGTMARDLSNCEVEENIK
tara:strand:- start:37 stop:591 length:555 start_codon:yes stop_codon:yes gene_type:complete